MKLRHALIRLAYENRELRSDVLPLVKEAQGFAIEPGGVRQLKEERITLQPNTLYWIGVSGSPRMIIVTKVTNDMIEYMNPYSRKKIRMERWIAADMIAQGSEKWLSRSGRQFPEHAKSIRSMLSGGKGKIEKLRDWDRIEITVSPTVEGDLWRDAERYGNVTGLEGPDGRSWYQIEGFRGDLESIKKDRKFKIESERKLR